MTHSKTSCSMVEQQVRQWLEQVVIGLNLCPFASKPYQAQQIRFVVSECQTTESLLTELATELALLSQKTPEEIETTLLILPNMLDDFDDYNQCLNHVDALIEQLNYQGVFQVASFHPNYQFGGTQPEDAENLTNRAPFPILHLIREASLERVLKHYPNPEQIPENNIKCVSNLSKQEKQHLFPYLFGSNHS
ncbi:hypothetical protein MNBD_GAMMA04-1422 [hydrothermal vent metagenome]|uniref:DUF1415 domain-containing protein n=1 Tax=hydrothermal vent metagenome TaxID=652676 RepID=A0A3B0VSY7_9ZZZZ